MRNRGADAGGVVQVDRLHAHFQAMTVQSPPVRAVVLDETAQYLGFRPKLASATGR